MTVVGIVKAKPDYVSMEASKTYRVYAIKKEDMEVFRKENIDVHGELETLLDDVDIVVDATPEGQGEKNMDLYRKHKVKAILQGGEKSSVTGISFNAYSNFTDSWGKDYVRVVSCNTTGLARTMSVIKEKFGAMKADATIIRRATDPNDSKKGPINSVFFPFPLPYPLPVLWK